MKVGVRAHPDLVEPSHGPGVYGHGEACGSLTMAVQEVTMVCCVVPEVSVGQEASAAFMALVPTHCNVTYFPQGKKEENKFMNEAGCLQFYLCVFLIEKI